MNINTIELEEDINLLTKKINELQESFVNYYIKVLELQDIWNDGHTTAFFEAVRNEQNQFSIFFENLTAFRDVYIYIYNRARKFGNKIELDFSNTSAISSGLNSIKQYVTTINNIYKGMDLGYCKEVSTRVADERSKYQKLYYEVVNNATKFASMVVHYRNLKTDIRSKTTKIRFNSIRTINYTSLRTVRDVSGNIGMSDTDSIEKALRNISLEVQTQSDLIDDFRKVFDSINSDYICKDTEYNLNKKQDDIILNLKTFVNNHSELVPYVNNIKSSYVDLVDELVSKAKTDIKGV